MWLLLRLLRSLLLLKLRLLTKACWLRLLEAGLLLHLVVTREAGSLWLLLRSSILLLLRLTIAWKACGLRLHLLSAKAGGLWCERRRTRLV